ncbi:MAG TPA: M1 family metallopeptidase [Acidimicrobiales bacterium]|nr:M1 family metallopeptidase [Acidimicrobiales bacterium]
MTSPEDHETPTGRAGTGAGAPARGETSRYRLPYSVVPHRYELTIAPDLDAASFSGEERVEIEILEPVERVVMNAVELEIHGASLALGWASDGDDLATAESFSLGAEIDEPLERVAFLAPSEDVPPGRYTLSCAFAGTLNDKLHGFYRSRFTDDAGETRVVATTQFEQTDARRAFPCIDEPDRKAVFSVAIDTPPGMLSVSNGPEVSSSDLGGGRRRVRFADTVPMSTYLVAFVVGPLEATPAVDVDGVALRVVHLPGKEHLAGPALEAGAHALRYFSDYFAIPYPGTKVDLVAIPDFAAGAMENLGCVTFRESILLADPDNVSRVEMERLAEVVEHELAHMWFGDLVTMRWWNGIWLNEAFATFMALCCEDDFRPEWEVFTSFARSKGAALGIDGLHATRPVEYPVEQPDEAAAMFDVLTYEKGASVLWMIERYLGTEAFRAGIRRYLAAHAYGNTETHDLWDAIEAEAGDVPIRAIMETWIFQGGYPLVSAESRVAPDGTEVVGLAQTPFAYLPGPPPGDDVPASEIGSDWLVPVVARSGGGQVERVVLGAGGTELAAGASPVVVNAGGSGFYRVAYDAALRSGLLAGYESLLAIERYGLVADTWASCLAGRASLREVSEVLARVATESDPHVWSVAIGALGLLDLLAPDELRPRLAAYTRGLLAPQLARVGWERAQDEDEMTPTLRAALVAALGTFGGDDAVARHCVALYAADRSGGAPVPADIAAAVIGVVAHHGHEPELDAILARYRNPRDPLDEDRHLGALGSVTDAHAARRVRELCLTEIRNQSAPFLLATLLSNRATGPATWEFVTARFDDLVERFPAHTIHRTLGGVVGLAQVDADGAPLHADGIRAFLAHRVEGGHKRLVDQSLERLEVNVRLARRLPVELRELVPPG